MNQTSATGVVALSDDVLTAEERFALRRVITQANGKGGAGKTSTTVETAGILAATGQFKVLIVDLDPQGNIGIDLGYTARGLDDQGSALFQAVTTNTVPVPLKNVRPNLDVLDGGEMTADLADYILGRARRGDTARGSVARALAKIASRYDVIFIDTPPLYPGLLDEALLAARWVVIPTGPNAKDIHGIEKLDARISQARTYNPTLQLLGVVLFRIPPNARNVEAKARADVAEYLGDDVPIFETTIRNVIAADADSSDRGQLSGELANDAANDAPWWKYLRGESAERPIAKSASSLAEDYMSLAQEIFDELGKQEALIATNHNAAGEEK